MDHDHTAHLSSNADLYAEDFSAWCLKTAELVRTGQWNAIDPEALAEELEDLGKNLTRELESRLDVLVMHLLKWAYQPPTLETNRSWYSTIREQRRQMARLLRDTPSLRPRLPTMLPAVYQDARDEAVQEMGILGAARHPSPCANCAPAEPHADRSR